MSDQVIWLDKLGMNDVDRVGGKNASLGEMISKLSALGVSVPGGFATTAKAYRQFLRHGGLAERINQKLASLDINDVVALADAGAEIRAWVIDTPFPDELLNAITES
jgi:pyruvate,water dikinase